MARELSALDRDFDDAMENSLIMDDMEEQDQSGTKKQKTVKKAGAEFYKYVDLSSTTNLIS